MFEVKDIRKIPRKSLILPYLIKLRIPGFLKQSEFIIPNVLSFQKIDSEEWFNKFAEDIFNKIGKEYCPIIRMSDGEYKFLLGDVYPYLAGHSLRDYVSNVCIVLYSRLFKRKSFNAATLPGVSSGDYSFTEINKHREQIVRQIKYLSESGVLALHLTYAMKPFQEHFHKPFLGWLNNNKIDLNKKNYYPFYFVYALLRGPLKYKLFQNRVVLIFHSATGLKKQRIIESLIFEGVKKVIWHEISSNKSLFDLIEFKSDYFEAEIAFVGAGVGKINILAQLGPLKIPCIDAGYVFEVWADHSNKMKRAIMIPDTELGRT